MGEGNSVVHFSTVILQIFSAIIIRHKHLEIITFIFCKSVIIES